MREQPVTIILVDDDRPAREGLADYLRDVSKLQVIECRDGREAMSELQARQPGDRVVVLLDLILGSAPDGLEVLDWIRKQRPQWPVIAFTGKDETAGAKALRDVYRYLIKPVDPVEIAAAVHSLAAQDQVLHELADTVHQLLECDICIVWRLDKPNRQFRVAAWAGDDLDEEYRQQVVLGADDPATRDFFARGEPLFMANVTDPQSAPLYRHRQAAEKRGWRSLLTVPLVRQGHTVALLDGYWKTRHEFGPEKDRVLEMVHRWSHQATDAIRNAELANQFQALQEINNLLAGTLKEDEVIRRILTRGLELVSADMGWLYLLDAISQELVLRAKHGYPPDAAVDPRRKKGEGITGIVAEKGVALNVPDTSRDPHHRSIPGVDIRSEVAVPLRREEQTIGVLAAQSRHPQAFTEDDVTLLKALATQAALAVERARLNEYQRQISEQALAGDERALCEAVVDTVYRLTGKSVSLWRLDPPATVLRIAAARIETDKKELADEFLARAGLELEGTVSGQAIRKRQLISRPDIFDPQVQPPFKYQDEARAFGWQAAMIAPLLGSEGQTIGTLCVYGRLKQEFSQWEQDLLSSIANQAAMALENIQRQKALGQLVASGQLTIARVSDEAQVLQEFVEQARRLTDASCAVIYPYDPEREQFYDQSRVVASGLTGEEEKGLTDKPRKRGLAAIVRHAGQIVVHDLDAGDIEVDLSRVPSSLIQDHKALLDFVRKAHFIKREGIKAFVGISLRAAESGEAGDEEVGVLYINYRSPHRFTPSELDLIQLFAQQVASLIRAARLWNRLQEQLEMSQTLVKMSQTLVQASRTIGQAATTEEVLKTAFREAFRFVGRATGLVISVEPGQRFRIVSATKEVKPGHKAAFHRRSPQESFGSFDWVVQTGRVFECRDTKKALAEGQMVKLGLPMPPQVTNIPLKCGGQVVGILVLDTVSANEQVRRALLALADIAGIALEKARALEHSRQQAEALRKVVEAIGSAADPLPIILGEAVKLFSAEYGFFAFVDPVAGQVFPRVFWEGGHMLVGEQIPEDKRARSWDEGITGFVARTGTSYCTGNAPEDPHYVQWYANTQSELAVPLKDTSEQTIGVLNLESSRKNAFSVAEEELCQHLANVAAAAIEKARLFEQMQQLNAQLESLHRVVQEQTLDEALDRVLEGINAILGEGTSSSINLYDARSGTFDPTAYRAAGPLRDYLLQVPPRATNGGGTGRYVVDTGKPLYLDDVLNPPPGCPTIREESIERRVKSFAALPLRVREQTVGVLFVNVQRRVSFTLELRRNLELFAKQAAIAIENARLFEQLGQANRQLDRRVRELEVLTEMSRAAVSTLGLDQILNLVYEQTARIMDLSDALFYIAFYDEARDEVSFGLAVEQDDGVRIDEIRWGRRGEETVQAWMPRSRRERFGLTEYVIHNKQPVLIAENFEEWARQEFHAEVWPGIGRRQRPTRSWLGVPMMVGGRVIGMISIQSLEREHAFDQGHRELLSTVANQAAVAIENARLYTALETNVRQLKLIQQIALEISSKLDLLEVLRAIAQGINQVLEADFTTIFPYDPERGFEEGVRVGVFDEKPSIPSKTGWGAQIIEGGVPVIVKEADRERRMKREFLERSGVRSFVGYPIQFAGQSVGLMFVNFVKPHIFTQSEMEWISYVASQAAVAIQNAKNFAKVREIERVQAAELMAADFLHRLGNYLGSIPPRLQIIQEHISSPESDATEIAKEIQEIIDEIAQTQSGLRRAMETPLEQKLQKVDLNILLRSAVIRVESNVPPEKVGFQEDYEKGLPLILCYSTLLYEVISTILQNAVDAVLELGGTVSISSRQVTRSDGRVYVEAMIKDTGPGIPESQMSHLFELFYTTKPKGIGYGLWRARNIVQQFGGDIMVKSKVGEGTEVSIAIPVRRG